MAYAGPFRKRIPLEKLDKAVKVYIGVLAYTDTQGSIRPEHIRWKDGQLCEVDRALKVREAFTPNLRILPSAL